MLSSGSTRSMQVWNKTKSIKELTPALLVSFGFWWQPGFSSFQTNCCKLPAKNNTEDMSPIPKTSPAPLPLGVTFMVDHLLSIWAPSPLQLFGHKFTKSFHNIQEHQILNLKIKSIYQARWDSSLMQHKKQPKKQGFTPVRPWRQVRSSWSPRCGGSQLMGGMRIPRIPIFLHWFWSHWVLAICFGELHQGSQGNDSKVGRWEPGRWSLMLKVTQRFFRRKNFWGKHFCWWS